MAYDEETYTLDLMCSNCENEFEYEIPKGTLVSEFIGKCKCEECGCIGTLVKETETEE